MPSTKRTAAYKQPTDPNRVSGPWAEHEDQRLVQLIEGLGVKHWTEVARHVPGRTAKQCRERYTQNLAPKLCKIPITPQEGKRILELVEQLGKKWAEIARILGNRSDNAIKNWWNLRENRRNRDKAKNKGAHPLASSQPNISIQRPLPAGQLPLPDGLATRPDLSYLVNQHPPPARPPPLSFGPPTGHAGYRMETPLPSPSTYAGDSDHAPSLMSDTGSSRHSAYSPVSTSSNYYATSPRYSTPRRDSHHEHDLLAAAQSLPRLGEPPKTLHYERAMWESTPPPPSAIDSQKTLPPISSLVPNWCLNSFESTRRGSVEDWASKVWPQ